LGRPFTIFSPTNKGNDLIKLKEAADAKIHAFIQMLGADTRLLTDGEEIVSHDLFTKWNSKKTITGEDESEETELKFFTEIRTVRVSLLPKGRTGLALRKERTGELARMISVGGWLMANTALTKTSPKMARQSGLPYGPVDSTIGTSNR
jgi:hypothetical protein